MTVLKNASAWSRTRRAWSTLGAVVGLAGAAWLTAVHSGSAELDRRDFKFTPIVAPSLAKSDTSACNKGRHPLDDAMDFVQPSLQALKNVKNYTAVFTKTELVHGRLLTQKMDMKCRHSPFSIYFHGHSRHKAGREVIFVAGQNDGRLIVHEVGLKALVGTLSLKPDDPKVMDTNRHLITDVGIAKIIESAIDIWKGEKKNLDPTNIEVRIVHDVQVGTVECDAIEVAHHHPQPGLTYQVGRIYVDKHSRLPVRAELYGWPATPGEEPPLMEQYTYTDVLTNAELNDSDFDPQNRAYRFAINLMD